MSNPQKAEAFIQWKKGDSNKPIKVYAPQEWQKEKIEHPKKKKCKKMKRRLK